LITVNPVAVVHTSHHRAGVVFELVNSPLNLDLCRPAPGITVYHPSRTSIAQSSLIGSSYSVGLPLTSKELWHEIGPKVFCPDTYIERCATALLTMFAAGFQDHNIGDVLGTDRNNRSRWWETVLGNRNGDLLSLMRNSRKSPYTLPGHAGGEWLVAKLAYGQRSGTRRSKILGAHYSRRQAHT